MAIIEDLNNLTKKELLDLIKEYDKYIQEANDLNKYDCGFYPVCINEFYNNDYFEIIKNGK